jgi:hypothetical protein
MIRKTLWWVGCVVAVQGCGNDNIGGLRQATAAVVAANDSLKAKTPTTAVCNNAIWKFVPDKEKLNVIDSCKTVRGTILQSIGQKNGDQLLLVALDAGQNGLLTKANIKKKDGNLVVRVLCVNSVKRKKPRHACDGYVNEVRIPETGKHVSITGSLVMNTAHGWTELYPVSGIDVE